MGPLPEVSDEVGLPRVDPMRADLLGLQSRRGSPPRSRAHGSDLRTTHLDRPALQIPGSRMHDVMNRRWRWFANYNAENKNHRCYFTGFRIASDPTNRSNARTIARRR
jgi:hypothetical protein